MGTIIINGQRFAGNRVEIRNGKVVIDGITEERDLHGDVYAQVVEGVVGHTKSVAIVRCSAAPGVSSGIQTVAVASVGNGLRGRKKR
jgi:hypothetical protein